MGAPTPQNAPQLTPRQKAALLVSAALVIGLVGLYIFLPLSTTTTTIERDAHQDVVKSVVQTQQQQRGDVVMIAGLGFAATLALLALFDGRIKLTAPGGAALELVATVAAADAAIVPLTQENDALRTRLAELEERVSPQDPDVRAALERWKDVEARIRAR